MKRFVVMVSVVFLAGWGTSLSADPVTLDACCKAAREHYPLVKQYDLISQSEGYSLSNVARGYFPQVALSGKATIQSDVTSLSLPSGSPLKPLDKDQYQIGGEVSQIVWDGGMIRSLRSITKASSVVDKKKLDADLYALNERVQQIYFGILMLDEQLQQNATLQTDLQSRSDRISAGVENGVANPADQNAIRVEVLNAMQRQVELLSAHNSYLSMLAAFTGLPIDTSAILSRPAITLSGMDNQTVHRPELDLFAAQRDLFSAQKKSILAANMPRLTLFAQGYYGRPGLNMLKNDFTWYGIAGARFVWNISGFTTQKNSVAKLDAGLKGVSLQEETFLFNTDLKVRQANGDIRKFKDLIASDDEIIALRTSLKKSTEAKVDNGVLSVTDLIRDITAENLALQTKSLHEIQLLMAQYTLKNTLNR